ncbi:MAG TPA: hypothetical protein VGF25_22170 [Thermoleophilaceae bacterium]
MRRAALLLALVVALPLAACGSDEVTDSAQRARLDTIRRATDVFKDVNAAIAAGYRPGPKCVESDNDSGALGLTYQNLRLNQDKQVNLLRPELLFYEQKAGARPPQLVGVGYLVPDDGQRPPKIPLGHLDGPIPGVGPGQVDRFEMHVWVHRHNPDGPLAIWNPNVHCL